MTKGYRLPISGLALLLAGILSAGLSCGGQTAITAMRSGTTTLAATATTVAPQTTASVAMSVVTTAPSTATTLAKTPTSQDVDALTARVGQTVVSVETSGTASGQTYAAFASGVVYSPEGIVITRATSLSAVGTKAAKSISIILRSGAKAKATIVGEEYTTGLVLLRTEEIGRIATKFSTSPVGLGDWVLAISGPGRTRMVKPGRITGLNGTLPSATQLGSIITGLLETDFPLPPESAGGGLFDAKGNLVGLLLGTAAGHGVAIPAATVIAVAQQLAGR